MFWGVKKFRTNLSLFLIVMYLVQIYELVDFFLYTGSSSMYVIYVNTYVCYIFTTEYRLSLLHALQSGLNSEKKSTFAFEILLLFLNFKWSDDQEQQS